MLSSILSLDHKQASLPSLLFLPHVNAFALDQKHLPSPPCYLLTFLPTPPHPSLYILSLSLDFNPSVFLFIRSISFFTPVSLYCKVVPPCKTVTPTPGSSQPFLWWQYFVPLRKRLEEGQKALRPRKWLQGDWGRQGKISFFPPVPPPPPPTYPLFPGTALYSQISTASPRTETGFFCNQRRNTRDKLLWCATGTQTWHAEKRRRNSVTGDLTRATIPVKRMKNARRNPLPGTAGRVLKRGD